MSICNILAQSKSLRNTNNVILIIMSTLFIQHETAKRNAMQFMKNGEITAYLDSLLEVAAYKRLMVAVISN